MKSIFAVSVLCTLFVFSSAVDDGKWHPEKFTRSLVSPYRRNGIYDSIYSTYQPTYKISSLPAQGLLSPYDTRFPTIATTAAPYVAVTYKPIKYSTPAPLPVAKTYYYANNNQNAQLLRSDYDLNTEQKTYNYGYESDNGISVHETGSSNGVNRVSGFYEFIAPDGIKYRVDYTADEFGFHPRGKHLPVPPV